MNVVFVSTGTTTRQVQVILELEVDADGEVVGVQASLGS